MKNRLFSKIVIIFMCFAILTVSAQSGAISASAQAAGAAAQSIPAPTINIRIEGAYTGRDGFRMTHAGGDAIDNALHNPTGTRIDASDWQNMQVIINGTVTGWEAGVEGDRARLSFTRTRFGGARLAAGQTVNFNEGYVIEFFFWPDAARPPATLFQRGDVITVKHVPSGATLLTHVVQDEPPIAFSPTHTILHIGDLHGHIDPNMSRIATIVENVRAEQPNTIVVDAGDTLHGTPVANRFRGQPVIESMNAIDFDAMVIGNHDFNYGSQRLLDLAGIANFPILGGNVVKTATGENFLPAHTVINSGGLRIGLVGLTTQRTPAITAATNIIGLEFRDVTTKMQSAVAELDPVTDVIVFLAHMDRAEELAALNAVPGKIIASISADTHVTTVEEVGGVILADSGAHGNVIGRLDLKIVNNAVADFRHTFITVDSSVALNQTVQNIVAPYSVQLNEILSEVIANSTIVLDRRGLETNLGNLAADMMLEVSGADLAIQNAGGIRAEIDAGPITVGEVMMAFPFENFIVNINLSGEEVIRMLEHGISDYPNFHGRHPVVAGVEFTFNPNKPVGSRIVDVFIAGRAIDKNEIYTVATNSFLAGGGDGYAIFVGKPVEDKRILLSDALISYLRKVNTISVRVDGRIQKTDAERIPTKPGEQRNVIFVHVDGTTQAQFTAARLLRQGVDEELNWDRMPHVAITKIHVNDSLQAGSVAGAVAHATGYRTNFDIYGLDKQGRPLTTLMEEADNDGFAIGIINSGSITEPGTGAFVSQVQDRGMNEAIALQIFEQRPDVVLGGGEQWFLPSTVDGRHGRGRRTDGRNLVEEAKRLGYTVVYTAAELAALNPNVRNVLGLFAANHIFNDRPESVLRDAGLPLYRAGSPTLAEKTEAAIKILSRNRRGFFLVVEEEGTDNFGNVNNAEGTIEATLRADDAIGVAKDFADENQKTLVLVAADSDAGGFAVAGATKEDLAPGQPIPVERMPARTGMPAGGPIDGVGGTRGIPFVTPEGFTFGIAWSSRHDKADNTVTRSYGLNSEYVSGTIDNIDIHSIFKGTLFNQKIELKKEENINPTGQQRNVIFIHPDGTTQAQFTAARLLRYGVDGELNWDKMPHVAITKIHVNDSLQAGSVAGAVAHATGYRTNFDVYGLDKQGKPLTTLMEEADNDGFAIGIINSGSITEPGTGAFVAQVQDRGMNEAIALQILEQRPDVVLGGGEHWFLPNTVDGRHGRGRRTDGRNLVEEAKRLGYTVVYTAAELAALDPNVRNVLGLFAAGHIFNDRPESVLRDAGLPLYRAGSPTLAEMTEAAIKILSRNRRGFFLVIEEEGTDNFGNVNNADGTIEATLRADDAIGVAKDFADRNQNTLVLVAADSDAGGFSVHGGERADNPAGQPMSERSTGGTGIPEGGPIDGVGGTRGIPYLTPEGFTFGIAWTSTNDYADNTVTRAYGINAEYVSGTIDNIDIYSIMRKTLGVEITQPRIELLSLKRGWNLVSTPIVLDENRDSLYEILYGLDWEIAYAFSAQTQQWMLADADSVLKPLDALFIFVLEEGETELIPTQNLTSPPSRELFAGWNLISLASLNSMRADRALISVHDFERRIGHAVKVISPALNREQWNFTRIDKDIPDMHPFKGYWLFMDSGEAMAGFTTTPLNWE